MAIVEGDYVTIPLEEDETVESVPPERMEQYIAELEEKMREAARKFDFKQAVTFRDRLQELKTKIIVEAS